MPDIYVVSLICCTRSYISNGSDKYNVVSIIGYCYADTCKNGGKCVNNVTTYTCTCPLGYTGKDCSTGKIRLYHSSITETCLA